MAAARRAGVLTAAGALAPADDGRIPTTAAAGTLAGAGGAQPEAELVARAFSVAAQRYANRGGAGAGAPNAL
eukprot:2547471-Pleurochrysis_carterae.AAC.1